MATVNFIIDLRFCNELRGTGWLSIVLLLGCDTLSCTTRTTWLREGAGDKRA